MSGPIVQWHAFRAAVAEKLSYKLALSHLAVTLIAQVINVVGVGLILVSAGQATAMPGTTPPPALMWTVVLLFFGVLFLIITAISSGVAATIGVVLARRFGQRLRLLADATETMARGDMGTHVAVTSPDEIGQIGVRFNYLSERLEEMEKTRRAFVSNISHDLRTPLAIIRGHVETLLATDSQIPPSRAALEAIARETQSLGILIEDLFTLTRIEEAGLSLQPRPLALHNIVAATVTAIQPLAARQGYVVVQSLVSPDSPPVLADPTRLTQILNNLLYNALRHTPDGGVIVVEARPTADNAFLEIAVTDTGVGIPANALPHIFDRFFQGNEGTAGSGLGLSIVKHLVEAQGGTVAAESETGRGTTIRFTLPRAE